MTVRLKSHVVIVLFEEAGQMWHIAVPGAVQEEVATEAQPMRAHLH